MRIFENQEIIGKNKTEYSYEALFFYLNSHFKKQMKSLLIILLFIGPITIYYLVMQLYGQRNYELGLGMFFILSLIIILSIFNLKVQAKKLSKRLIDSQIGSIKNVIFYKDYFSIEATFVNGYSFNVY